MSYKSAYGDSLLDCSISTLITGNRLKDTINEVHIKKKKSTLNPVNDEWHLEWIKIQRSNNPDVIFHYNDWIKNEKIVIA